MSGGFFETVKDFVCNVLAGFDLAERWPRLHCERIKFGPDKPQSNGKQPVIELTPCAMYECLPEELRWPDR